MNIHQRAEELGRTPREFVDDMVQLFPAAEDALLISPDRFIRTTDPDHYRAVAGDGPPRLRQRRRLPGQLRGLVLPQRGLQGHHRTCTRTRPGSSAPTTRTCPSSGSREHNWFFRLSRYEERLLALLRGAPGVGPARVPPQRDARVHPPGPRGHLDQPRDLQLGHPVPDPRGRHGRAAAGRLAGTRRPASIYVWFDALINYITGAGFPDDPDVVRTAGGRPTCTSSARTSTASTRSSGRRC